MKIIIHGGFFSESNQSEAMKLAKQNSLKSIAEKAFHYLLDHSATETVIYTVSLLEDDELYNAGMGSQIQSDGEIRMSAAIMNGKTEKFSGVINIEHVKNPVLVAEKLMAEEDRVLGGNGAKIFADLHDFENFSTELPSRREEYEARKKSSGTGTVGCVALDREGNLAAATSTGGKGFELVGRISDSATVAGNYANQYCAVSCTGVGEDIVSNATAAKIVTRVTDGMSLAASFKKTFQELKSYDGFAGAIAIDIDGNVYHQDSFPTMVFASYDGKTFDYFK